jgi:cytoplasmic iron level regulating protein YaaA (DUF328/UPF0246 family)
MLIQARVLMAVIASVSCVKTKQDTAAPAAELYTSDWFRKARRYVEEQADRWFILSAKHGLVQPDEVLEPYEKSMHDMTASERREWASQVVSDLIPHLQTHDQLLVLAGRIYRDHVIPAVSGRVKEVVIPMEGLGIGQQKAWLKKALRSQKSLW